MKVWILRHGEAQAHARTDAERNLTEQGRAEAKKAKNFALADSIRKDLLAQGIVLKDSAQGTTWEAQV